MQSNNCFLEMLLITYVTAQHMCCLLIWTVIHFPAAIQQIIDYLIKLTYLKMSIFSVVEPAPPVEIFALSKAFKEDTDPNKVDLGIGGKVIWNCQLEWNVISVIAYRTNEAKPWVLPVVRKAEKQIVEDESLNHEYLGQLGHEQFSKAATLMLLGEDSVAIKENRVIIIWLIFCYQILFIYLGIWDSLSKWNLFNKNWCWFSGSQLWIEDCLYLTTNLA